MDYRKARVIKKYTMWNINLNCPRVWLRSERSKERTYCVFLMHCATLSSCTCSQFIGLEAWLKGAHPLSSERRGGLWAL